MPLHVSEVVSELIHHPIRRLVRQWNWKSALLSPIARSALVFATNATAGSANAGNALMIEALYRTVIAGFCGTIVEAFRSVDPYWAGQLTVLIAVPLVSDSVDVFIHWSLGTPQIGWTAAVSLCWTVVSTAFNYFAMRRGSLIVGDNRRSLFEDLLALPALFVGFVVLALRHIRILLSGRNAATS